MHASTVLGIINVLVEFNKHYQWSALDWFDFDFIEYFITTFLHAHSWLNWVDVDDDEDEVGLKEKPEDTRYIKNMVIGHFTARSLHSLKPSVTSQPKLSNMSVLHSLTI